MVYKKLVPIIIGALIIFQIISAFTFIASVMAIIGCLIVLISAIQWELKGGIYSATMCSLIVLATHLFAVLKSSSWLSIVTTILLYLALGVGIGGVIRTIRKQRLNLELSEARNRQLSEQGRIFTWEIDEHGLYTYVDHMVEVIMGYSPEELVFKKHFYDLFLSEEREMFKRVAFEALRRKEAFLNLESKALTKNGKIVWLSTNGIPVVKDDGTLQGYHGSDVDITARKQVEVDLKESEGKYASYIENAPDGVFISDENGHYLGSPCWTRTSDTAVNSPVKGVFNVY